MRLPTHTHKQTLTQYTYMYLVFAWALYIRCFFRTDLCQGHSVGASRFKLRPHFGQPQLLNNMNIHIYSYIDIYI